MDGSRVDGGLELGVWVNYEVCTLAGIDEAAPSRRRGMAGGHFESLK